GRGRVGHRSVGGRRGGVDGLRSGHAAGGHSAVAAMQPEDATGEQTAGVSGRRGEEEGRQAQHAQSSGGEESDDNHGWTLWCTRTRRFSIKYRPIFVSRKCYTLRCVWLKKLNIRPARTLPVFPVALFSRPRCAANLLSAPWSGRCDDRDQA